MNSIYPLPFIFGVRDLGWPKIFIFQCVVLFKLYLFIPLVQLTVQVPHLSMMVSFYV